MKEIEELLPESVALVGAEEPEPPWTRIPCAGGVYGFLDRDGKLIQLASGLDLRRIVRHRLELSGDAGRGRRRADLTAVTAEIRWLRTESAFETAWAYYRVARRLYPRTYRRLIAFGPAWFVHVDPQNRLPRFVVTSMVYAQPGRFLGPFPTRGEAAEFVAELEDAFDLCRYHDILDKTPDGQACAYHEMGKCPAPCDGSVRIEVYNQSVEQAGLFAWGRRDPQIERWRSEMEDASRRLAFERAGMLKTRIDDAMRPLRPSRAWVRGAEEFCYLYVQRAGGTSWVRPFFAARGLIEPGDRVRVKELAGHIEPWSRRLSELAAAPVTCPDPVVQAEQVWLVSHFLFKGGRAPGCFFHLDELPHTATALERLRATFARRGGMRPPAPVDDPVPPTG